MFALECTACCAISDAYELLKLALNANVPPGVRFRNGRILRVLIYISMASPEVAVMDGDHVHLKPAHSVSHSSPTPSTKAHSSKASSVASSTLASSIRSNVSKSCHNTARCVCESSRDAMWLGVWGRLAALHESLPANADFWQQLAFLYPEAFAAISKLEDDAWSKMVQRSYVAPLLVEYAAAP